MDGSGRGSSVEDGPADGAAEPSCSVEDGMRELSIGGGEVYPERPGEPNCAHYVRTGHCKYGARCRYHHPRDRSQVEGIVVTSMPERMEQPVCLLFMKTGYCKYGASCKYYHQNQGDESGPAPLNCRGYPLRLGKKECSHYLKTGLCKFGINCKFHHPDPSFIPMQMTAPAFHPQAQSPAPFHYGGMFNWQASWPALFPGSYAQGPYDSMLYTPGMVPVPSYFPYAMPPLTYPYLGPYSTSLGASSNSQNEEILPERPGEPECQYYMRKGDCKYGSSCKYHHPRGWLAQTANCASNHFGYPSRPGAPPCTFYAQHGSCKFGRTCKFDHPMDSPSSSSLVDLSVAHSSCSLELQPELTNEDASNSKVAISEKTSIELEGQDSEIIGSPQINEGQDSEIIGSSQSD